MAEEPIYYTDQEFHDLLQEYTTCAQRVREIQKELSALTATFNLLNARMERLTRQALANRHASDAGTFDVNTLKERMREVDALGDAQDATDDKFNELLGELNHNYDLLNDIFNDLARDPRLPPDVRERMDAIRREAEATKKAVSETEEVRAIGKKK